MHTAHLLTTGGRCPGGCLREGCVQGVGCPGGRVCVWRVGCVYRESLSRVCVWGGVSGDMCIQGVCTGVKIPPQEHHTPWTQDKPPMHKQSVTPSRNRTTGLGFQVQHAPFYTNWALATSEIFKHLFMHHLIFGLDDQVKINRLYKDPKASVLQANVKIV